MPDRAVMSNEAINMSAELFIDSAGDVYPVSIWLDHEGDPCGKEDAMFAIAGTEGRWYCLDLSEFDGALQ